jgi:hypothetical protein
MEAAVAVCIVCQNPVVVDPVALTDGRIIHRACQEELSQGPARRHPRSGSKIRAGRKKRVTG